MAGKKSSGGFIRKNITLPPGYEERLRRLREASGAISDSELIRQALNSLEKALALVDEEDEIAKKS